MLNVEGLCTCGETFDGRSLTEEQLAKLPEAMRDPIAAVDATPLGVVAQVWWDVHMAKVPARAREHHTLSLQVLS